MLISVLINHYNYGQYLPEAVDSILQQTYPLWELIIVDDGSTDGSDQIALQQVERDKRIRMVSQENGGQLSAFNRGVAEANGEVVTFLDADDRYHEDYLQKIAKVYQQHPECDFLFCGYQEFGASEQQYIPFALNEVTDLGYTAQLVRVKELNLGKPTSTQSLRTSASRRIFPLPFCEDWRYSADNALNIASSMAMMRKFCLPEPLMFYRIHDQNNYAGKSQSIEKQYYKKSIAGRLKLEFHNRFAYAAELPAYMKWADLLYLEAQTGNKPRALLKHYGRVFRSDNFHHVQPQLNKLQRWYNRFRFMRLM